MQSVNCKKCNMEKPIYPDLNPEWCKNCWELLRHCIKCKQFLLTWSNQEKQCNDCKTCENCNQSIASCPQNEPRWCHSCFDQRLQCQSCKTHNMNWMEENICPSCQIKCELCKTEIAKIPSSKPKYCQKCFDQSTKCILCKHWNSEWETKNECETCRVKCQNCNQKVAVYPSMNPKNCESCFQSLTHCDQCQEFLGQVNEKPCSNCDDFILIKRVTIDL